MAQDIRLPDIGDFKDVPIIEILVSPGQAVKKEATLLTLESDKATLDVPAPEDGVIGEILVKVGDKVSQGSLLATYASAGGRPPRRAAPPAPAAAPQPAPAPADFETDLLVLGAGPGGYTAAFRAADLGQKVVLVDRRPELGGVCLNVGCIPSKALLHVAKTIDEAAAMAAHGVSFGAPSIDLAAVRKWKDGVVKRLTTGLTGLSRQRKVTVVQGRGRVHLAQHRAGRDRRGNARRALRQGDHRRRLRAGRARASFPPIRASGTRPRRSSCASSRSACSSSAAASSASRWRPSIVRSARASPSSK